MGEIQQAVEKTLNWLWQNEISEFESTSTPSAIVFVGQPGAGKTILSNLFSDWLIPKPYLINGDAYRRFHPHYKEIKAQYGADFAPYTSEFSNALVEQILNKCIETKRNIIIEGTGRDAAVPISTAEMLRASGYHAELAGVAVRPEWSLLGIWRRYLALLDLGSIPRTTSKEIHDNIVNVLPENLDLIFSAGVFSRIRLFDREARVVYDSSTAKEAPSKRLIACWNRPWDKEEQLLYKRELEFLKEKLSDVEAFQNIDFPKFL